MSGRLRVALLALGFALVGLIGLIAVFDGADTYRDIARASGVDGAVFHADPDLEWHIDLNGLVDLHQRTLAYVLGDAPQLPAFASTGRPLFDDKERSHLADVRAVFQATKLAFVAGVLIVVGTLRWTGRPRRPSLVRNAAIAAGVGVAALAVAAALAFEAVFQLFHEVFFPQGNFLFPPNSNLLILYPEPYWYGVTLRIGAACIVLMAIVALAATATLRRARR
jgi:integral membrane protein (TIGR01906 family)